MVKILALQLYCMNWKKVFVLNLIYFVFFILNLNTFINTCQKLYLPEFLILLSLTIADKDGQVLIPRRKPEPQIWTEPKSWTSCPFKTWVIFAQALLPRLSTLFWKCDTKFFQIFTQFYRFGFSDMRCFWKFLKWGFSSSEWLPTTYFPLI